MKTMMRRLLGIGLAAFWLGSGAATPPPPLPAGTRPATTADHTLKLSVKDASGATASAQATIPVANDERNNRLPLPKLGRRMNFAERLLAAMRHQFGGHAVKKDDA